LPRWILPESRLHHIAQDGFVNFIGINIGAAYGFGDDFSAKLDGRKPGKTALKFSYGRANSGKNYGSIHV
jgi:hypothetical protein